MDLERLGTLLGHAADASERYRLEWPGKLAARREVDRPARGVLAVDPVAPAGFDEARHVFISGENLEVLRLLRRSYAQRVKLIYVDPPYNTGGDLLYHDDFSASAAAWRASGQRDRHGRRHSGWLSFMYPRLALARELLRSDGAIAVQIDDNELHNLIALMDELFGAENRVSTICVKMSHLSGRKMAHLSRTLPKLKEYIVVYARERAALTLNPITRPCGWGEALDRYTRVILDPSLPAESWQFSSVAEQTRGLGENGRETWCLANSHRIFRTAVNDALRGTPRDGRVHRVRTPTGLERLALDGEEMVFARSRMREIDGVWRPVIALGDLWTDIGINNLHNEGGVPFANGKKPLKLVRRLISLLTGAADDLVLDFFAGSGTTGEAVVAQNAEDGGTRRYVLVQIPVAPNPADAEARSFTTLAQLCRTRLQAVAARDAGGAFRALQGSALGATRADPGSALVEAMVRAGLELGLPLARATFGGVAVTQVGGDALWAVYGLGEAVLAAVASGRPRHLWACDADAAARLREVAPNAVIHFSGA